MAREAFSRPFSRPFPSVDTLCVGGVGADPGAGPCDGDPLVFPLVQSTTFVRSGLDSRAEHAYSRVSNPTVAALEQVLGRLEGAPPAVCFATGLAAETALFLSLLRAGDHVVCGRGVYGGTTRLLQRILSGLGIASSFVDARDTDAVRAALRPQTRLVFIESPSNPLLELTDIAAVAQVAHAGGALLAVDNTFLTAALQRPLDLGADLSVCSTTKFVDGHSAALGGSITAREPALLDRLRFLRKCTGAIQTPFHAWLTLQGVKTLPLRLRQQSATAARLAAWLEEAPAVARVHYPSLGDAAHRALAARQHLGADGAVVSFELAGGMPAARALLAGVRLCRLVEHVGSVETLLTHSATMTHADVAPEERRAAGIGDGLVRLSVGLEDFGDLVADLGLALARGSVPEEAAVGEVGTSTSR
jgi:cystathionine beta-lyase/cystathionine gamma-synthase